MTRRRHRHAPRRRASQSGYAYLTALFMVLAMLAGTAVFLENALTASQRRREEELIWRGNQYKRAIRLYFHKTGHYPQDLDALKKGLPQLHFLRQAYKDPMSTSDGGWRFIYVNAAGQLIGSMRYASLQQMALLDNPQLQNQTFPQLGVSAASLANTSATGSIFSTSAQPPSGSAPPGSPPAGASPDTSGGTPPPPAPGQSGQGGTSTPPADQSGSGTGNQPGQPLGPGGQQLQNPILLQKPTGAVDGPVLGAFLTGVAPKELTPSRKWFHHAKIYKEWEFIWNPLDDQAAAAQNQNTAIPLLGAPAGGSASGSGSAFGPGSGSAFGQGGSGSTGSGNPNPFGGPPPQGNPPQ
jgi:hypothetical protein